MLQWLKKSMKMNNSKNKDGDVAIHTFQIFLLAPIKSQRGKCALSHNFPRWCGGWGPQRGEAESQALHSSSQTPELMFGF